MTLQFRKKIMTAIILNGKRIANEQLAQLKVEVDHLKETANVQPSLKILMVGNNPASQVYVRNKIKRAEEVGIDATLIAFEESCSEEDIIEKIQQLNADARTHAILVQLPLPQHLNEFRILEAIDPKKDVDGFTSTNVGLLRQGKAYAVPATAAGVIHLLKAYNISLKGKHAVILGRSQVVGKPLAEMLLQEDASVTILHSQSENVKNLTKQADILISAVGKINAVTADMVKDGAVVIDVGINYDATGKLVGDVDFEKVKEKASAITPVPGSVGPMTIATLIEMVVCLAV